MEPEGKHYGSACVNEELDKLNYEIALCKRKLKYAEDFIKGLSKTSLLDNCWLTEGETSPMFTLSYYKEHKVIKANLKNYIIKPNTMSLDRVTKPPKLTSKPI